mmetsp:Transcript_47820/g.120561  ORF Transcript_47820/g.120561 Transcript_47820/m.120561 type:complete len:497 (+) Transcript_47820:107-1597(+)
MPSRKSAGQRQGVAGATKKKGAEKYVEQEAAYPPAVQSKGAPVPTPATAAPPPAAVTQDESLSAPSVAAAAPIAAQLGAESEKAQPTDAVPLPSAGSNGFFDVVEDDEEQPSSAKQPEAEVVAATAPPQQDVEAEEFHEIAEGDMDDPLSMLAGMGQEELYTVTAVPQVSMVEEAKEVSDAEHDNFEEQCKVQAVEPAEVEKVSTEQGETESEKHQKHEVEQIEALGPKHPCKDALEADMDEVLAENHREDDVEQMQDLEVELAKHEEANAQQGVASMNEDATKESELPEMHEVSTERVEVDVRCAEEVWKAREFEEVAQEEQRVIQMMVGIKQTSDDLLVKSPGGVRSPQAGASAEWNGGSDSEGEATCSGGANTPTVHSHVSSHSDLISADVGSGEPQLCHVSFDCSCTQPGERLALVGEDPALGGWDTQKVVQLTTSATSFPIWSGTIAAPAAGSEFKLVISRGNGNVSWEPIAGNRTWPSGTFAGPIASYGK